MAAVDPVEATRALLDARDLDARLAAFAPDAVWEAVSLGTSFEGTAAIRDFLEVWSGAYADFKTEAQEVADIGNGVVFVVVRLSGHPRGSAGSALERRRPLILTWADGQITKVIAPSSDLEEARVAAQRLAESRA